LGFFVVIWLGFFSLVGCLFGRDCFCLIVVGGGGG
jgi:hypothetical protein